MSRPVLEGGAPFSVHPGHAVVPGLGQPTELSELLPELLLPRAHPHVQGSPHAWASGRVGTVPLGSVVSAGLRGHTGVLLDKEKDGHKGEGIRVTGTVDAETVTRKAKHLQSLCPH